MKHRILSALVLLVALSGCAYQSSLDLYLKGQLAAEQGHLPTAMAALSQAIKENPRLGVAYIARANLLQQQGNMEAAQKDYEQAVKIEPYNFTANFQLGVIYQKLKRFGDAIKSYEQALQVRPLDPTLNMNLGLAYVQTGDLMLGISYAQRARDADPGSAMVHANLGVLYAQAQLHTSAIDEFKKAIELDGHQPEIYLNLGQEYFSTAAYEQARNVLETAQSLAPSVRVSERLGATYYRLRNFDKAEAAYRDAVKLDGKDVASLNGLGATLMSKALLAPESNVDTAKTALGCWNQSLALDKNQPTIQNLVNQYTPHE